MTQAQILRGPTTDAPTPARRTGGLLDVADIRSGIGWVLPQDMFVSWNCLDANSVEVCGPDSTPQKTFEGPTLVDGVRFAVYLGGQCKPLGADVESNIDRVFDLRESRGVEKVFEVIVLGSGSVVAGTPVSAAHALALMENALGDAYAGVGTIHMSPLIATLLLQDQLIYEVGGKWYTHLGTKVVIGTGYTSSTLYGTGDVVVYEGTKDVNEAPDTTNNVVNVLAERAYVVVADCVVLKITGIPQPVGQSNPTGPTDPGGPLNTGTDELSGVGDTWTAPSGTLRSVTVVATNGSVEVDGTELTAPDSVSFDSDEGESLDPPTIKTTTSSSRAYVSWVVQ